MAYGPTPEAVRFALRLQLSTLNDELRLILLSNSNLFLNSSSIGKSIIDTFFGILRLKFFVLNKNKYVICDIGLSNKTLPVWLTESEIEELELREVKEHVEHWTLKNITLF